jgi:multiple inositol-polyphosphate phosphatase/2,3-bisphosphoglycerate 3-phosphatase
MEHNWCKLFDKNDFRIIEYLNDLKNYWLRSYGHTINTYATCHLLLDWMKELDKFIENNQEK